MPPLEEDTEAVCDYLSTFCWDEQYPPLDGPFQNRTYGRRLAFAEVLDAWRRTAGLMRKGRAPRSLGLYLHWPFCPARCSYCACDAREEGWPSESRLYLRMLLRELEAFSDCLEGAAVSSVQICGGTPTQASPDQLDELLTRLAGLYALSPGVRLTVEASPSTLSAEHVEVLVRHRVGRLDLGLDTLDDAVARACGRAGRAAQDGLRALDLAASAPALSLALSLVCGLPSQTRASFLKDLCRAAGRRPSRIRVYGFDPRPQTPFAQAGGTLSDERRGEIRGTLGLAAAFLRRVGYAPASGGWREPASVLGLGASAQSRAYGSLWYQHPPLGPGRVPRSGLPAFYGGPLDLQQEERAWAVRSLFNRGRLDLKGRPKGLGRSADSSEGLWASLRALEREGSLLRREGVLFLASEDPARREPALKRLYDPAVREGLLDRRREDYQAFLRERPLAELRADPVRRWAGSRLSCLVFDRVDRGA